MEKKTIGKFISALRRANGMTQRELADRLFVSDKTISRWERDESVPDITLIPVIAELFGVTSDELIRGERDFGDKADTVEAAERNSIKTGKSIRAILYEKNKRRGNFLLISLGLTFLGLVAAMISDLAFSEGLIGFCLMLAFVAAGEICGIVLTRNSLILSDSDDFSCGSDEISVFNGRAVGAAVRLSVFNICAIGFCIPLVTVGANYGVSFDAWAAYGAVCVIALLLITYILRVIWVNGALTDCGLVTVTDEKRREQTEIRKKLIKVLAVFIALEAVIFCGIWFNYQFVYDIAVEKQVFHTCTEFKDYVEKDVAEWRAESEAESARMRAEADNGIMVETFYGDSDDKYDPVLTGEIYDGDGRLICQYEYIPYLYKSVQFTASSYDKTPITVITYEAGHNAASVVDFVGGLLLASAVADFVGSVGAYLFFVVKIRKQYALSGK